MIGLVVTKSSIDNEDLPLGIQRPEVEESSSYIYILIAIALATVVAVVIARLKAMKLWKFWFFVSIWFTLFISFNALLRYLSPGTIIPVIAFALAIILALWKVLKHNLFIHNLTELFIYAGLAAIFVPILNLTSVTILLVVISIYDIIAVWRTKHMVTLAKFQTKAKLFAGLHIPYGKNKEAVLGGGDIGFPLLFLGVVLKQFNFWPAFVTLIFLTIALFLLLTMSQKNKFYPAMPFLSIGCFVGFWIGKLLLGF